MGRHDELDRHYTPESLAVAICRHPEIRSLLAESRSIIEPSVGGGALLRAALQARREIAADVVQHVADLAEHEAVDQGRPAVWVATARRVAERRERDDQVTGALVVDVDAGAPGLDAILGVDPWTWAVGDWPGVVGSWWGGEPDHALRKPPMRRPVVVGNPPFSGADGIRHVEASLRVPGVVGVALILPLSVLGVARWADLIWGAPESGLRLSAVLTIPGRPWPTLIRETAVFVWRRRAPPVVPQLGRIAWSPADARGSE